VQHPREQLERAGDRGHTRGGFDLRAAGVIPSPMISVEEASALILDGVRPLPEEDVKLLDAHGRVLSQDVRSPVVLPPWDNAGMDGYAIRAEDLTTVPMSLPVTGTIAAGSRGSHE